MGAFQHNVFQKDVEDAGDINDWIRINIPGLDGVGISIEMNRGDRSVRDVRFSRELTDEEKSALLNKYPELNPTNEPGRRN